MEPNPASLSATVQADARARVEQMKRDKEKQSQNLQPVANGFDYVKQLDTTLESRTKLDAEFTANENRRQVDYQNSTADLEQVLFPENFRPPQRERSGLIPLPPTPIPPYVAPTTTVGKAIASAEDAAQKFSAGIGDKAAKIALTVSATKLKVLPKVAFSTGLVATAPAGVILSADQLNTIEREQEIALERAEQEYGRQVDAAVAVILDNEAQRGKLRVMKVWTQDP